MSSTNNEPAFQPFCKGNRVRHKSGIIGTVEACEQDMPNLTQVADVRDAACKFAQLARLESIGMSAEVRSIFWNALGDEVAKELPSGGPDASARRSLCRALLQHGIQPAAEDNLGLLVCQIVNALNEYHQQ